MSISADMLRFDNPGQSFVSARHSANLIQVVETARLETLCALRDSSSATRTLAFIRQALIGFQLQYANAYVLQEYAHAEMQHRFATNGIMVGRTPTGNGIGVMQNDPYLKNLLHMALGGKNPFDFSYRGIGIDSVSPTFPEFIGDRPQALFIGSDINLNSFLAQRDFEVMIAGDTSPSRALNYHINKAFAPGYFMLDANIGGDPSNYVEELTAQGIDISVGQISTYQWAALLLSNGYWTSVGSLRYYAQDTETATPISWRFAGLTSGSPATVYWPEFSTFLNKSGVSGAGEMTLDLGASGRFVVAIERNIIGFDQGADITVGVSLAHNDTKITTRFTGNRGMVVSPAWPRIIKITKLSHYLASCCSKRAIP